MMPLDPFERTRALQPFFSKSPEADMTLPQFQELSYTLVTYPHILGSDAAGVVVSVGPSVTRFKLGDRVIGWVSCCC
jgi:threonine dehydrogenase-like Zn-dependent dehydrogenase